MKPLRQVTFIPTKKTLYLNQIYSMGWECALARKRDDGKYDQINVWVTCKDYLNDIIHGYLFDKRISIYGMAYSPEEDGPIDNDKLRLLVRNKNGDKTKFENECKNALQVLHYVENIIGFKPSRLKRAVSEDTKDTNIVCLFEADKKWMHATPLLSLYTILARKGCGYTEGDILEFIKSNYNYHYSHDGEYMKDVFNLGAFDILMKLGTKAFLKKKVDNYNINHIHDIHNFGLVGWARWINGDKLNVGYPDEFPKFPFKSDLEKLLVKPMEVGHE